MKLLDQNNNMLKDDKDIVLKNVDNTVRIDISKLNIKTFKDIENISDELFYKHKINSILVRQNNLHQDCYQLILHDKTKVFIDNDNNKTTIYFIKTDIIKQQLISLLQYIFNTFKAEPNIFFYIPKHYNFLSVDTYLLSKLHGQHQVLLKKWIPGLFSNFNTIIKNKILFYNKFQNLKQELSSHSSDINNKEQVDDIVKQKKNKKKKKKINKIQQKYIQRLNKRINNLYEHWNQEVKNIDFLFLTNGFFLKTNFNEVKTKQTKIISLCEPIHQIHKIHFPIVINTKSMTSIQFVLDLFYFFLDNYYKINNNERETK